MTEPRINGLPQGRKLKQPYCVYSSSWTGKTAPCGEGKRCKQLVFPCSVFGECTLYSKADGVDGCCSTCHHYLPDPDKPVVPQTRNAGADRTTPPPPSPDGGVGPSLRSLSLGGKVVRAGGQDHLVSTPASQNDQPPAQH